MMAQRKNKRKSAGLRGLPTNLQIKVGQFDMVPSPDGKPRRIRIEFPAKLTTQEKYDVATALAKAAGKLVAEADKENEVLATVTEAPPAEPSLHLVKP